RGGARASAFKPLLRRADRSPQSRPPPPKQRSPGGGRHPAARRRHPRKEKKRNDLVEGTMARRVRGASRGPRPAGGARAIRGYLTGTERVEVQRRKAQGSANPDKAAPEATRRGERAGARTAPG